MSAFNDNGPWKKNMTAFLGLVFCAVYLGCESSAGTDTSKGSDQNGRPNVSFPVRHGHFANADRTVEVKNDLPPVVTILLHGIPGNIAGQTTRDTLFSVVVARDAEFQIPWSTVATFPAGTQPRPYAPKPGELDSISPAATGLMRIGTFAGGKDSGPVFPDSSREAYGFWDTKLNTPVTLLYFTGSAAIKADYQLCDSTRFSADIKIPSEGFYFLYQKSEGENMVLELLPDPSNLVFQIVTFSNIFNDYQTRLSNQKMGCFDALEKVGAGNQYAGF